MSMGLWVSASDFLESQRTLPIVHDPNASAKFALVHCVAVHSQHPSKVASRRWALLLIAALAAILLVLIIVNELVAFGPVGRRRDMQPIDVSDAIGATMEPLDGDTARAIDVDPRTEGLVVTSVARSGAAANAGIRTGDVIERIGRRPVRSLRDAAGLIGSQTTVTLTLNRRQHYAKVRLLLPSEAEAHAGREAK